MFFSIHLSINNFKTKTQKVYICCTTEIRRLAPAHRTGGGTEDAKKKKLQLIITS
jgi:hypothetical protein